MDDELSLDFILDLEKESRSPSRRRLTHLPRFADGKYVTIDLEGEAYECTVCNIKTHIRVESVPYCSTHTSHALFYVIDRLQRRITDLERETNAR